METNGVKGIKLKLCIHQKHHYKEVELLVNVRDLGPNVKEGDILEIYHAEDVHQPRLLLQIPRYEEDISFTKDSISVEQYIASSFQLRSYKDVIVNKVDPKSVTLELLELTFKDQYLGRSDMWRLKMSLVNTVTYLNKKIEFCSNSIRCQTYEMWAHGEKVTCGVITEDTKIVFRSSTCQAYLFLQMSSEMWEFDLYGELYFEKAVNGFLAELFTKWKSSNHDVTIVLFSRTYYKATSIEDFPVFMRDCLLQDYQGRFYEDFYRVAIQNERYDDWLSTLGHLRQLFHSYLDDVLRYHCHPGQPIPEAYNSNAPQGNFLEVLNISLNVFEKHYLDRSFERTGQMSVVVTPGVGVFEVDRELTNITKQRIIDNGVGSDLVCLGEQPLHAVPLLKFHKKRGSFKADDYSMPHTWINLSFYSSKKRVPGCGTFIPRIKVPQEILKIVDRGGKANPLNPIFTNLKSSHEEHTFPNSIYDYDAYDAQVFKIPTNQHNRTYRSLQRTSRKKTTSQSSSQPPPRVSYQRKLSDPDLYQSVESMTSSLGGKIESVSNLLAKSPAINIPSKFTDTKACSHSFGALNIEGLAEKKLSVHSELEDMSPSIASKIGSSGTNSPSDFHQPFQNSLVKLPRSGRSLINPFNPSHVTIKLTSNRRRWIHTFPKGPTGLLIQQHHYQMSSVTLSEEEDALDPLQGGEGGPDPDWRHRSHDSLNLEEAPTNGHSQNQRIRTLSTTEGWPVPVPASASSSIGSTRGLNSPQKHPLYSQGVQPPPMPVVGLTSATLQINKHASLLWGATGEQEWNSEITTGVDWKSLTLPACLPLTTDYFPDQQSLQYDYEVAANYSRLPDSFDSTFLDLVSQRLSQGFQLIMRPEDGSPSAQRQNSLMRSRRSKVEEVVREYKLSIGRVFHWLQFKNSSIDVTIYRPKHPYPPLERQYRFRFRSPYLSQYELLWGEFKTERLENYKWNNLDNYICFKGDRRECRLVEEFKYWRFRLMVLPDLFKAETKKLGDAPPNAPCDIYHTITLDETHNIADNFIRFLEVIHRVKRNSKKSRGARERLGSMRTNERPRVRPVNKASERVRFESGSKDKEDGGRGMNDPEDDLREDRELRKLSQDQGISSIVEAMRDPSLGVPFITAGHALPAHTFISYEATTWVLRRVEDIPSQAVAVSFMQKLCDDGFVRHAAGDAKKAFVSGFHLYYFVTETESPSIDPSSFEAEWHEITIAPLPPRSSSRANPECQFVPQCPSFLKRDLGMEWAEDPVAAPGPPRYHVGYLEIDGSNKSDRYEWGHLKYQTRYTPQHCFEMIVQWMCATGTLVNDLILTWQRKAANQALHLFPVPTEPFATPCSFTSNPLRSPIVIALNVGALGGPQDPELFSEFSPESRQRRMYLFQESILERFGFLRYESEGDGEPQESFVHATGNMIVLISTSEWLRYKPRVSDETSGDKRDCTQPCFLWTFNYMLTRRWKSITSADEAHGERILKDFKDFCANGSARLRSYWDSVTLFPDTSDEAPPFVDVFMQ